MDNLILAAPRSEASVIPTQKYTKEIMRVGKYRKGAQEFTVDEALLAHWKDTFSRMKFSGTKIPVPSTHTFDPEANRGWVREMTLSDDGKSLIATIEAIGADAVTQIARNDVSIYSPTEYIDSKGTRWERPIMHVALTTQPVVGGMQEAIAASEDSGKISLDGVEVLELELEQQITPEIEDIKAEEETPTVDPKVLKLSQDNTKLKLDVLVNDKIISPAVASKLQALITEDYVMSNSLDISAVLDILGENKILATGTHTKPQTLVLDQVAASQTNSFLKYVENKYSKEK